MTNTAVVLKQMTDRSLFEKIAGAILRKKYPKLRDLIESGLNEKGETRKSPLDAFSKSGRNEYSFIEYTTDDSNLKEKWLHDTSLYKGKKDKDPKPEGDLRKAIRLAKSARLGLPAKSKFAIYLVTNQQVGNELAMSCETLAQSADVDLQVVELSILADYLDHNPYGQWLRKEYLKIDATLPSKKLFTELSETNRIEYAARFSVDKSKLFVREEFGKMAMEIRSRDFPLHFLVGNSGMGKTYFSYWYHESENQNDSLVLIVDPKTVIDASNPIKALFAELRKINANLYDHPTTLRETLNQFSGITLIVDDINLYATPSKVVDQLISWSRMEETNIDIKVICPIWPSNFYSHSKGIEKPRFSYSLIKEFVPTDCKEFIKREFPALTSLQVNNVSSKLGNDPLLTGLYITTNKALSHNPSRGTYVIEDYIRHEIRQIASQQNLVKSEVESCLNLFGLLIIRQKTVTPTYSDIKRWLPNDSLETLKAIFQNKKLIFLDDSDTALFRHDRVRDQILVDALKFRFSTGSLINPDNAEIISDPFFAKTVAGAITGNELSSEEIDHVLSINPVVLFQHYVHTREVGQNQLYLESLLTKIKSWSALQKNKFLSNDAIPNHILNTLMEAQIDLPEINEITESFPENDSFVALTKFKFGNFISAIRYLLIYPDFQPMYGNVQRDQVIDHVKSLYYERVKTEITRALIHPVLNEAVSPQLYQLAGYWKSPEFAPLIFNKWEQSESRKESHCINALWAIIHTATEASKDVLEKALKIWQDLPDEGHDKYNFPKGIKNHIVFTYSKTDWKSLTQGQIDILKEFADNGIAPTLVRAIFEKLDAVPALEFMLKHKVGIQQSLKAGCYSPYLSTTSNQWNPNSQGKQLSKEGLAFFKSEWQNMANDEFTRSLSFNDWCNSASNEEIIAELKRIKRTDKNLYRKSLYRRISAGDKTVIKVAVKELGKENHFLWNLYKAWNEDAKRYVVKNFDRLIANSESEMMLGTLLSRVPASDSEEIIRQFPESLSSPFLFQAALATGTPVTIGLANMAFDKATDKSGMFLFLSSAGILSRKNGQLYKGALDAVAPYLSSINQEDLMMLAYDCQRQGFQSWARNMLPPFLTPEDQERFFPSNEKLLKELKEFAFQKNYNSIRHWVEKLHSRMVTNERIEIVMEEFAQSDKNEPNFLVLCNCIQTYGKRRLVDLVGTFASQMEDIRESMALYHDLRYAIMKNSLE